MLFESAPPPFTITVGSKMQVARICSNYAEGAPGEVFGILGSMGFLELAANRGSAFQLLGAGKGSEVNVIMERR
jgi:S-adenosylmethionine hydrolase